MVSEHFKLRVDTTIFTDAYQSYGE